MAYKRVDGKKIGWGILGAIALYYLGGLVSGDFGDGGDGGGGEDFTPDPSPGDADTSSIAEGLQPTPMPEPLQTPPPETPAPAAPPAVAPTPAPAQQTVAAQPVAQSGLDTPKANGAGMEGSFGKWFTGLSKEAQGIIAGGITGGAGAVMNGITQKNALEDKKEMEERARQDKIRRGQIPDISSSIIAGARR